MKNYTSVGVYWDSSIFQRVKIPNGMIPKAFIPKGYYSDFFFSKVILLKIFIPKGHYSSFRNNDPFARITIFGIMTLRDKTFRTNDPRLRNKNLFGEKKKKNIIQNIDFGIDLHAPVHYILWGSSLRPPSYMGCLYLRSLYVKVSNTLNRWFGLLARTPTPKRKLSVGGGVFFNQRYTCNKSIFSGKPEDCDHHHHGDCEM